MASKIDYNPETRTRTAVLESTNIRRVDKVIVAMLVNYSVVLGKS